MVSAIYIVSGLIVLGILVNLIWRVLSQRQALPCPSWLGWMVELDNPLTRVNRAQFIVEHLGLEPGMKVLDAGCGPGRVTLPLAKTVGSQGKVVALDVQEEMLARVRGECLDWRSWLCPWPHLFSRVQFAFGFTYWIVICQVLAPY
jgi:SAM-dependent methyltransferase